MLGKDPLYGQTATTAEYLNFYKVWFFVQSIGTRCVPEIPAEERDTYIRQVSSTVGLAALAATVVRVAPGLLLSLCSPGSDNSDPILAELGKLEERILVQLAEAETWKRNHDATTAVKGMIAFLIIAGRCVLSVHLCLFQPELVLNDHQNCGVLSRCFVSAYCIVASLHDTSCTVCCRSPCTRGRSLSWCTQH